MPRSSTKVWGGNENITKAIRFCEELDDPGGRKRAGVFNHNSMYVKMHTDRDDWKYGEHRVAFRLTMTALKPNIVSNRVFNVTGVVRGFHKFPVESKTCWRERSKISFGLTAAFSITCPIGVSVGGLKRCLRNEYACRGESYCIYHKFVCDGFNNCGDGSDEKCQCQTSTTRRLLESVVLLLSRVRRHCTRRLFCLSNVIALASIIVVAILITVLIGVFIYYIRKKRRNRPYVSSRMPDTSRATSTQSVHSDTSLFGTVRETYYRPLYPIGEGLKIKLDELPKDPEEPLFPPHYLVKGKPSQHLPTRLLLTTSNSSSQNDTSEKLSGHCAGTGGATYSNDEDNGSKTLSSATATLSSPTGSGTGARPKTGTARRGSFPPTRKSHREEALVNIDDVNDLKELSRRKQAAENSGSDGDSDRFDEVDGATSAPSPDEASATHQATAKHIVLLPQ
ncbi:hypothetical protein BIW11_03524 [Tropilaelaps mercedesae]|uniref:Uncharacterized protein n=1 Tax=Tropilaelaps mercedesae TaxID=418985 RepID=A0A1V9XJM4_9ACAR|nr:hypothetical protein BIW11_03524 [Tropilaelaps mercedesae]